MFLSKLSIFFSALPMIFKTSIRNLKDKKYEPEVFFLQKVLKEDHVFLDIGGAYGRYAYPISKVLKKGRIFSFEPGSYSFFVLSSIKFLFGMKRVHLTKKALGNEMKKLYLISPRKESGKIGYSLSYISESKVENAFCEEIEMITIDSYFSTSKVERLDLIKCDCEGAELLIFKGGENTIEKFRPVVLSEVDGEMIQKFGFSIQDMESFFHSKNYLIFELNSGALTPLETISKSGNFFFIPQEKSDSFKV